MSRLPMVGGRARSGPRFAPLLLATIALAGCSRFESFDAGPRPDAGVPGDAGGADAGAADGSGAQSIVLLYTNDEHSGYLGHGPEIDDFPARRPGDGRVRGGLLRRAAVLERLESEARRPPLASPVALIGSGGRTTGSLFQLANLGLGIDFAVTSVLAYDVLGIGPADLELGAGALATALRTGGVSPMFDPGVVRIPVVASNLRFSMTVPDDDGLADLYLPEGGENRPLRRLYLKDFGGVRVGFLGLVGIEAAFSATFKFPLRFSLASDPFRTCTLDAQCPGSVCVPPAADPSAITGACAINANELDGDTHGVQLVTDAAAAVAELRRRGADLVVALTAAGVDEAELRALAAQGLGPERATRSEDIAIAKGVDQILGASGVRGIDVIAGGFSGTVLETPLEIPNPMIPGQRTFIVQAGTDGEWVGALRLVRPDADSAWQLDPSFSRLEPVDDRIDTSTASLSAVTSVILEQLIRTTIQNLEGVPIAIADGVVFPGEQCDGDGFPNRRRCDPIVPDATGGELACFENRQLDLSSCTFAHTSCNGGARDGREMCDGADLGDASCLSLGYDGGELGCLENCAFDVSRCERDFPSVLEILFRLLSAASSLPRIIDDPDRDGDLYFYPIAETGFDLSRPSESAESNLLDLVADAQRWAMNNKIPRMASDPVEITVAGNAMIRQGLARGSSGTLSMADLFRVLPLGVSPQERSPGFALADFWVRPAELRAALELGVGPGLERSRFWLGVSGARIEYDPTRPIFDPARPDSTGRITRIVLARTSTRVAPWEDGAATLEATPIFDADRAGGAFPDPSRLVHVGANLWVALLLEGAGSCPRDERGEPAAECRACSVPADCTVATTWCDTGAGRCVGQPAALSFRTLFPFRASRAGGFLNPDHLEPFWAEELKDFYSLLIFLDALPGRRVPDAYQRDVPRRVCCVGAECGTRACP